MSEYIWRLKGIKKECVTGNVLKISVVADTEEAARSIVIQRLTVFKDMIDHCKTIRDPKQRCMFLKEQKTISQDEFMELLSIRDITQVIRSIQETVPKHQPQKITFKFVRELSGKSTGQAAGAATGAIAETLVEGIGRAALSSLLS